MNFNKLIFILIVLISLLGCVKIIDLSPPHYIPKYVLNGLINPDSVLTISLNQSVPTDSSYKSITISTAIVTCYEDGVIIGQMIHQARGLYKINYRPQAGKIYRVEAKVSNLVTLSAEDYIPPISTVKITLFSNNEQNINDNPDIGILLQDIDTANTRLWFSSYLKTIPFNEYKPKSQIEAIESISPYLDPFNSRRSGYSIKRTWINYVRLIPEYISKQKVEIKFNLFNPVRDVNQNGESLFIHMLYGSRSFDNYLKSSITGYKNRVTDSNGQINNPFVEPMSLYSNVTNGSGIFAGYNSQLFNLIDGGK